MKYYNCVRSKPYSNPFGDNRFVLKPANFSCMDTSIVA